MVAELLAGIERKQHGAAQLVGIEHDGRAAAAGSLDLAQVPALHRGAAPYRAATLVHGALPSRSRHRHVRLPPLGSQRGGGWARLTQSACREELGGPPPRGEASQKAANASLDSALP